MSVVEVPGWETLPGVFTAETDNEGNPAPRTSTPKHLAGVGLELLSLVQDVDSGSIVAARVRVTMSRNGEVASARIEVPASAAHGQGAADAWARLGVPLSDAGVRVAKNWLGRALATLDAPTVQATARPVWIGDRLHVPGLNAKPTLDALPFGHVGDEDAARAAWRDAAQLVVDQRLDRLAIMLGASVISPQLSRLAVRPFTVHAFGSSTGGKSTALEAAGSIWGPAVVGMRPTLAHDWNQTARWINNMLAVSRHLPFLLDETKTVDARDPESFVRGVVMGVASGSQRGRATQSGGIAESDSWSLVLLSTGEHQLTSGDTTGDQARAIQLPAPLTPNAETADRITALTRAHHGWPGKWLTAEDWPAPTLPKLERVDSPIAQRLAPAVSACVAGFAELCGVLGVEGFDGQRVGQALLAEVAETVRAAGETVGERVYDRVMEAVATNPGRFPNADGDQPFHGLERDLWGLRRDGVVYVFPQALKERIAPGLDATTAARDLRALGRLDQSGAKKDALTARVSVPGLGRQAMYGFRLPEGLDQANWSSLVQAFDDATTSVPEAA